MDTAQTSGISVFCFHRADAKISSEFWIVPPCRRRLFQIVRPAAIGIEILARHLLRMGSGSGSSNDQRSTDAAHQMVAEFGQAIRTRGKSRARGVKKHEI
ncbi:hypothetical protein [Phyllobacterium calauticae]|uniref:hypothetical protein n=1 Tax=Phyllobacterium calauticae TaxID=2817027 RepID=UPI001CBDF85C|nr:hypothetical protein [Phyllobacterium calauticae]